MVTVGLIPHFLHIPNLWLTHNISPEILDDSFGWTIHPTMHLYPKLLVPEYTYVCINKCPMSVQMASIHTSNTHSSYKSISVQIE